MSPLGKLTNVDLILGDFDMRPIPSIFSNVSFRDAAERREQNVLIVFVPQKNI